MKLLIHPTKHYRDHAIDIEYEINSLSNRDLNRIPII